MLPLRIWVGIKLKIIKYKRIDTVIDNKITLTKDKVSGKEKSKKHRMEVKVEQERNIKRGKR